MEDERLFKWMDRIETKLDANTEICRENEANLREHMRRTDLLEKQVIQVKTQVEPIQKHVDFVKTLLKGFLGAGALATAAASVAKLLSQ